MEKILGPFSAYLLIWPISFTSVWTIFLIAVGDNLFRTESETLRVKDALKIFKDIEVKQYEIKIFHFCVSF